MAVRLKRRLPDAKDEALLSELLEAAGEMIRAYTGRDAVPEALRGAQIEVAAMLYNRMGMEGESTHDEGALHRRADSLPEYLKRQLNPYRLARTVV